MSPEELTQWRAYYQLEPWGANRDNWHAAQLAMLVHNSGFSGKRATVNDFMYSEPKETVQKAADTFVKRLRALAEQKKNG